jgi:hypothetical protein
LYWCVWKSDIRWFRPPCANRSLFQPGGQDSQTTVKDIATKISANYVLQTAEEQPAYIIVKTEGWMTGAKDVLEKLHDPNIADTINPTTYKYRINLSMETGDDRYAFVNTVMWIGSGCRRGHEGEQNRTQLFFLEWEKEKKPSLIPRRSHPGCLPC